VAQVQVPAELVDMIVQRRLIPFIGAGFSAPFQLPNWDLLLHRIADEIETSLSYAEIKTACNDDPLQIAEYLFLKSDRSIGPIRHKMSLELQCAMDPVLSPSHVELVNLGAPQIYTTNYDDIIENTFRRLDIPYNVIALPKHVAAANTQRTQIVKYHGDLRHENTLVLTESSYYTRLDFESPMDLKFRSDLLGKSVLFMGYSFRDLNIRVIWFKLMRMMKDIPEGDRPRSYIVRFEKNPVLELLYESVGLRTIVLDPDNTAKDPKAMNALFANFMFDLSAAASQKCTVPGSTRAMFVSTAITEAISSQIQSIRSERLAYRMSPRLVPLLTQLARRQVPPSLRDVVGRLLLDLADVGPYPATVDIALKYVKDFGSAPGVTAILLRALTSSGGREAIRKVSNVPWLEIWSAPVRVDDAKALVMRLRSEVNNHKEGGPIDDDIAYAADVVGRLVNGEIQLTGDRKEIVAQAKAVLRTAAEIYPVIADHKPSKGAAPAVDKILDAIKSQIEKKTVLTSEEDIPF
jgi:hypothetical protein